MSTVVKLSGKNLMLSIGLMSGTSMDGIDAALLRTSGTADCIEDLGHSSFDYPSPFKILLKAAEFTLRTYQGDLSLARIHYVQEISHYLQSELQIRKENLEEHYQNLLKWLKKQNPAETSLSLDRIIELSTDFHAVAVKQLLSTTPFTLDQIDVVGYHGQTLLHRPEQKICVIIGDGNRLAQSLGVKVVNDFRSRDIQAGGQGAPLAPLYHHALARRDNKIPLAVVNCGGIANISLLNSPDENAIQAFDTGPGNGLIDQLVRQRTQGQEFMDDGARYGLNGRVHEELLSSLYARSVFKNGKNYFDITPPKSLDIGDLHLPSELNQLSLEDACATLEAFTADSIVKSLKEWSRQEPPLHWVLCGGGWKNPVILRELRQRLRNLLNQEANIKTADAAGWNSQAMEAQIFAYLAVRSLKNLPLSLPGTTGAPFPICGGRLNYPSLDISHSGRSEDVKYPG
jgi:anhydro-N-acetylmuramic acid kinase